MSVTTALNMVRGDNKTFTINFKDSSGDPIDISGWRIFFTLKMKQDDSDAQAKLKKDSDVASGDGVDGKFELNLVPVDTSGLNTGKYYYDVQAKKDDGNIFTALRGEFTIFADITTRIV